MCALNCAMPRYYFDVWDDDDLTPDDTGLELDDLEAAKKVTAKRMADLAKDKIADSIRRVLAIEVRDEANRSLLEARLVFEMEQLTSALRPSL
jgi:hypothetical protein